jgi:hypothetical protein
MAMKDEAENEEEGLQAPSKSKSGGRGGLTLSFLFRFFYNKGGGPGGEGKDNRGREGKVEGKGDNIIMKVAWRSKRQRERVTILV